MSSEENLHSITEPAQVNPLLIITYVAFGWILPFIAVIGVVCNTVTLMVLWRREMISNTVYFLRALAVSDILFLLIMVTYQTPLSWAIWFPAWNSSDYYRRLVYPSMYTSGKYLYKAIILSNVWITVGISVERFFAIMFPFTAMRVINKTKCLVAIASIVLVSCIYCIPYFLAFTTKVCVSRGNTSTAISDPEPLCFRGLGDGLMTFPLCESPDDDDQDDVTSPLKRECYQVGVTEFGASKFYQEMFNTHLYGVFFHFIPLSILLITNVSLIVEVTRMMKKRSTISESGSEELNFTVTIMLILVIFIICHTPAFISVFEPFPLWGYNDLILLTVGNDLLAFNSAINFIIYTAFGKKFRQSLMVVVQRASGIRSWMSESPSRSHSKQKESQEKPSVSVDKLGHEKSSTFTKPSTVFDGGAMVSNVEMLQDIYETYV